jgi:hypothetical protein
MREEIKTKAKIKGLGFLMKGLPQRHRVAEFGEF